MDARELPSDLGPGIPPGLPGESPPEGDDLPLDLLYVSRLCSEQRLADLLDRGSHKPAQQEQKFHGLLARGLAGGPGRVTALSVLPPEPGRWGLPVRRAETEKGLQYRYLSLRAIPLLSHALVFAWSFLSSLAWAAGRQRRARFVLCDVLDLSISAGALLAAKLTGTPAVALVTDVPNYLHDYIGQGGSWIGRLQVRVYRGLATSLMERYSGYLLLTEAMDAVVNPRGRPHLVMEGVVDPGMATVANTLDGKLPERVVLYAGALYRKYGVGTLLEAFRAVPREDARLWIFGTGELAQEMEAYQARDARITYWGVRPNAAVVAEEVRATLLVNPRPSDESFTRFSFPSKNMEYMASGTPVVTTRLPGMPDEYLDHVYTFPEESVEGMAATLRQLLDLPPEELHRRGEGAKAFVLARKSGPIQAGRVRSFLRTLAVGGA